MYIPSIGGAYCRPIYWFIGYIAICVVAGLDPDHFHTRCLLQVFEEGGVLKRTVLRLSAINLIVLMLFLFVRLPSYTCDAVEMAKHYDRKSEQFDELVTYAYSASFQQKPAKLKRLLRKTGCRSIDTSDPEYCELEYKRVGFDSYSYRIYRAPMSDEAVKEYSEKYEFIPHNSRMVMKYSGGATSELGFPYSQREKYYKKHPRYE